MDITYDPTVLDEIVERLSQGEPLRAICRDPHMPSFRSVYNWIDSDTDFAARIARARELGYEALAEETLAIADDSSRDTFVDDQGRTRTDSEVVARSKLRVETRLKLLAKWSPNRYGDKLDVKHGGAVSVVVATGIPQPGEDLV